MKSDKYDKHLTYNKQFGKIAAEVTTQAAVKRFTIRDSPNGSEVESLLSQAAGTLPAI